MLVLRVQFCYTHQNKCYHGAGFFIFSIGGKVATYVCCHQMNTEALMKPVFRLRACRQPSDPDSRHMAVDKLAMQMSAGPEFGARGHSRWPSTVFTTLEFSFQSKHVSRRYWPPNDDTQAIKMKIGPFDYIGKTQ
jgi:hypothetical protein